MKTRKTLNYLEHITNGRAQGSSDRAFSNTSMSQHHQGSKTSISSWNLNRLYTFQRVSELQLVTNQQPTNIYNEILNDIL